MVSDGHGRGAVVCCPSCAGSHGLGNDLQLMRTWFAMFLLGFHFRIVLQEELTGFLQHSPAFTDGAAGKPRGECAQSTVRVPDRLSSVRSSIWPAAFTKAGFLDHEIFCANTFFAFAYRSSILVRNYKSEIKA